MLFKNVENSTHFNFYFHRKLIPLTSDHKHLRIIFSLEAKWNKHVENIIKRVSKHIYYVLRKLEELYYLICIRPIFEYACKVWDNCGISNSCKLEILQLEAVRLPTQNIYNVEKLEERRTRRKLQLFYHIQNGSIPLIIPPR